MVPMPYFQKELLPNGTVVGSPYLSGNPTLYNEISQIPVRLRTATRPTTLAGSVAEALQQRSGISVAYTYSKCMTDSSGYYGSWGGQTTPVSPYWQNLYDKKAEWGPCYYDVTHVLTSYATYDLPFGRDRKFGKNMNPVVNAVAGDWQVNAILSLHTGFALTTSGPDASGTNSRGARPDCLSPAPSTVSRIRRWAATSGSSRPSVFGPAAPGTFGTCGVGTVRGPGSKYAGLSLAKFFSLTERFKSSSDPSSSTSPTRRF